MRWHQRLLAATATLGLALGMAVPIGTIAAPPAQALSSSDFNASNIIADGLFYDDNAMTTADIQSFLNSRIGSCANGLCLNVANVTIPSQAASISSKTGGTICGALQGGVMSAAELIYRVQVACGISAKVILVTLQKEQGLVTSQAPSDSALKHAMGMACPDSAPCDTAFEGLATQIYTGARQLNTYKAAAILRQPGPNYIGYSPNPACGGTTLNIANYATAALYNYTPYQPNAAALNSLGGTGDGCSTYGNRNFWVYYNNWFGSTQDTTEALWLSTGGASGPIGAPTGSFSCVPNTGCYRDYEHGRIYWSWSTGAHFVPTNFLYPMWANSWLGSPNGDNTCGLTGGGCFQSFQNGVLYTSPNGVLPVQGGFLDAWTKMGREAGAAGYPLTGEFVTGGGVYQEFQNGRFQWSPSTGPYFIPSASVSALSSFSWLGFPIGNQICGLPSSGCYQPFQKGNLFTSPGGIWPTQGGFQDAWSKAGWVWGAAGYPLSAEVAYGGGVYQNFQNGTYEWSPSTGPYFIPVASSTAFSSNSWLGFPTSNQTCGLIGGGCSQTFQRGVLYSSDAGVWPVQGGFLDAWTKMGGEASAAGYPTSAEIVADGGVYQNFQNGRFQWSAKTGPCFIPADILDVYLESGGPAGHYGFPVAVARKTGTSTTQQFQFGTVTAP